MATCATLVICIIYINDGKTDKEEKICSTDPVTITNIMKLKIYYLPFFVILYRDQCHMEQLSKIMQKKIIYEYF